MIEIEVYDLKKDVEATDEIFCFNFFSKRCFLCEMKFEPGNYQKKKKKKLGVR